MEKLKALALIEQVCGVFKGTLNDHQQIQEALRIIKEELKKQEVLVKQD